MAFIKSADNRRDASFAVSRGKSSYHEDEEDIAVHHPINDDLSNWEVWQP